jgi:DNA-binding PucR family transcriptional regulator
VAIGEPTAREELADALAELRLVLDLAERIGCRGRVTPDAFLPELLVTGSPRLAALIRERALGPLERYSGRRGSDLLETLAAFVDCDLDRRRCAERLAIHPNTLDYRLRRIEELTNLELRRPTDLTLVTLALAERRTGG